MIERYYEVHHVQSKIQHFTHIFAYKFIIVILFIEQGNFLLLI